MPLYDPKGTRWASYTTTQHGLMPVTAAATAGSVKGRVAVAAIGKWQQKKKPSVEVAMRPLAGPPSLIADAAEATRSPRWLCWSPLTLWGAEKCI